MRSVANADRGRRNRLHAPGYCTRLILGTSLLRREISVQSIAWIFIIALADNVRVIGAGAAGQQNNRAAAVGNVAATAPPSASTSSHAAPAAPMASAA